MSKKKVEDVRLEAVDNGYKVCCYMYEKKSGASEYDSMVGSRKEFVYPSDDFSGAASKFKKLAYMQKGMDMDEENGEYDDM